MRWRESEVRKGSDGSPLIDAQNLNQAIKAVRQIAQFFGGHALERSRQDSAVGPWCLLESRPS